MKRGIVFNDREYIRDETNTNKKLRTKGRS